MNPQTKRRLVFLAGFALYFGAIWFAWDTPIVYPLKVFVVLLHEISHGIAALATGGTIQAIELDPAQGGVCYCPGGNAFLTLSAGYLGSLGWGALLLMGARAGARPSRWIVGAVGLMVVVLTLLYVRNSFGFGFGLLFGLALFASAAKLPARANRVLLTTLGLTSCLYAILDIKSDIIDRPELQSDARMLAEMTGVPTMVWGFLWIGIAVTVALMLFRKAFREA